MKTSTIAEAKNNLSNLIHQLDAGEAIHLTRYGKPVAVMMSENQYQSLMAPNRSLSAVILQWRSQLDVQEDVGFSNQEFKALSKDSVGREFSWGE